MSYPNWVFSLFSFLGFVGCMIPLPWHLEAWNTGTCLYMIWTGLGCLVLFINSIIWNGHALNLAPVWCDISTHIIIAGNYAIPACALAINRRLYHISCVNAVTVTKAEKRRGVLVDLAIGLGIPVIGLIFQYINAGHRFDIYEDVGCWFFTYGTPLSYVMSQGVVIAIGLVSAVYCVLSIRSFNKRRLQFKQLLSSSGTNLSGGRYIRLMCLAGIDIIFTIPTAIAFTVVGVQGGVSRWISWEDTHWGFSAVHQYPAIQWRATSVSEAGLEMSRWSFVVCAIIFFIFFGFAEEARKHYRLAFASVAKRVGYSTMSASSGSMSSTGNEKFKGQSSAGSNGRGPIIPVSIHREVFTKRDSNESFSDLSIMDAGGALSTDEKAYPSDASFGALSLADVGNTLKYDTSSSSSDTSSIPPSPIDKDEPVSLPVAVVKDELSVPDDIEVSSLRRPSYASLEVPAYPQRVLDPSSAPRHSPDAPVPIRRDSADMV